MNTDYDVIIVGGGLAGTATAICLAKLLPAVMDRVLILEKARHPRKKGCGGAVNDQVLRWLERNGVCLTCPPLEIQRISIVLDREDPGSNLLIQPAEFNTLNREQLDDDMFRHASRMGTSTAEEETVLSVEPGRDRVLVRTTRHQLTAGIVVGADGAGGVVRRALHRHLGSRDAGRAAQTLYLTLPQKAVPPDHGELEALFDFDFAFERGICGYAWYFPAVVGEKMGFNAGIYSFGRTPGGRALLGSTLKEFLSTRGIPGSREEDFLSHPIPGYLPSMVLSIPRVLLAGDAAGVDPLLGEGISFALGYGEVAARCIATALETGDHSLASYREGLLGHGLARNLATLSKTAGKVYGRPVTVAWRKILYDALSV